MTTQAIKKYKEVFYYWLIDGNKAIFKDVGNPDDTWDNVEDLEDWDDSNGSYIYIQNDAFVEFRKAKAEGKTLQFYHFTSEVELGWWDESTYDGKYVFDDFDITCVRVKPTEPKFKVGDFVKDSHHKYVKVLKVSDDGDVDYVSSRGYRGCLEKWFIDQEGITAWKPKEGDVCLFYNNNQKSARIARFNYVAHGAGRNGRYKDMQGNYFTNCEPYNEPIPENMK